MSDKGDYTKFGITKLTNGNYQLWKFKIEMLLSKDDLWNVVSEPKPTDTKDIPLDWEKKDRMAKAIIGLSVEDDQLIHIRKETTSRGMWLSLQKLHEHSSMSSKLFLLRKIHQMRLPKNGDMQEHITSMLEVVERLRGIGEDMKDNYVACMLLCSLPEAYGSLITALEARPESDLTLNFVCSKLIDEFNRRQEGNSSQHEGTAESALKSQYRKNYQRKDEKEKNGECFFCKKPGHFKRNCPQLRNKKMNNQDKNQRSKVAFGNQDSSEKYNCTFTSIETPTSDSRKASSEDLEWYIDSGATSHMTSHKSFFTRFEET